MSLFSRMATWWRAAADRDKLDRQVREELEFHLENHTEDLMRSGVPREEALRRRGLSWAVWPQAGKIAGRRRARGSWMNCGQICAMPYACWPGAPALLPSLWDRWRWESG